MPITLICPRLRCRATLRVPDNVRGKRVRCSECGVAFFVPEGAGNRVPPPKKTEHPSDDATNAPAENPA